MVDRVSGWRETAVGLPSDEIRQRDGSLYMARFFFRKDEAASVRFHRIVASDPQDFHDHPWNFISLILEGSYREHTPDGSQVFGPGDVLMRRAEDLHRLELISDEVWTFVSTGRLRRRWGFQTPAGWVHWSQYGGRDAETVGSGSVAGDTEAGAGS